MRIERVALRQSRSSLGTLTYNGRMAVKQKNAATVTSGRKSVKRGGPKQQEQLSPKRGNGISSDSRASARASSGLSASKRALHLCLKRLKNAKDESEIRRLTEELQRIVFHRQYRNAEN
jgi:hypothetical protein